MKATPHLVEIGQGQARNGDVEEAVKTYRQALKWKPDLSLEPEAEAKKQFAYFLIQDGEKLVQQGNVEEALAAFADAQERNSELEISAGSWNNLCWHGALYGYVSDVMGACEKAVKNAVSEDKGFYQDCRGLARALTGNAKGAIKDFQSFVNWSTDDEVKSRRQRWIRALEEWLANPEEPYPFTYEALQEGRYPFESGELNTLRHGG